MKALFLFSALFVSTNQHVSEGFIPNNLPATKMEAGISQTACIVKLREPMNNGVLGQEYIEGEKLESNWKFTWDPCPGATKYHLFVIGPNALNPIVDNNSIKSTFFWDRSIHYGIKVLKGWSWKVRAYLGGKWGEWSEIRTFNVNPIPCTISGEIFGRLEVVSGGDTGGERHTYKLEKVFLTTPDGKKIMVATLHNRQYLFKNVPAGKTYRIYPELPFKSAPDYIEISNARSEAKYNKKNLTIRGVKGDG